MYKSGKFSDCAIIDLINGAIHKTKKMCYIPKEVIERKKLIPFIEKFILYQVGRMLCLVIIEKFQ